MLVKNGTIVNEDGSFSGDMRIEHGIIVEIAERLCAGEHESVTDAAGCYVLPGGIDAHTHLDMPAAECKTSDDFVTGTKAAVMGGTTTIIDFAECEAGETLLEGLKTWHKKAGGRSYCDYSFHMTIAGWNEETRAQMEDMMSRGIVSFKAYTAYKDIMGVEDGELFQIMECVKELGAVLCVHCENGDILSYLQQKLKAVDAGDIRNHPKSRPNLVEKEAVSRVVDMAALTGAAVYIVHVSTGESMEVIRAAKERGQHLYAETCPQYLLLDESKYGLPGFESAKFVLSPPLRRKADQERLWQGICRGEVDAISTDHCSFDFHGQKELGKEDFTRIPNGMPGIEHRMPLLLEHGRHHGMAWEDIVKVSASGPAKAFGLYPKKGRLQPGSDADVIIVRENVPDTICAASQYQQVDYTPYEGMVVTHKIEQVFVRGEQVVKNGMFAANQPKGVFVPRYLNIR